MTQFLDVSSPERFIMPTEQVFTESLRPEDIQEFIEEVGDRVRFRLSALGAIAIGWLKGALLNDKEVPDAGEIKYVETPIRQQNQGISKDLIKHALGLMKERGSTKVIMGAISEEGAGLIQSLRRHGIFGRLIAKDGGDGMYEIPGAIHEGLAREVLRLCDK